MTDHLARNLMTWATILLAVAAVAGSAADVFPTAAGLGLAKWSIVVGAAGRAIVHCVQEWAAVFGATEEVPADDAE